MTALLVALGLCILGMIASVLGPKSVGRTSGFALLGIAGIASVAAAATRSGDSVQRLSLGAADMHAVLRLDATAAYFVGVLGGVAALVAIFALGPRGSDERRTGRTASASACSILFASLLACAANDVLLFIFAWELLALTFYWAIAYGGTDKTAPRSAYVAVAVTHIAGACIVAAMLTLARTAGSFDVDSAIAASAKLPTAGAGIVLVLLLVGFGAKFGMLPVQGWMPYGYRSAPAVVTALMAGGALNVGFYALARFVVSFPVAPLWFATLSIAIGAITAFFGIAWAAAQRDLSRLAAFSSIENGGIILAAFGVAIAGRILHQPGLTGFGVAAAFVQIAAHAAAKTTLFLCSGSIGDACGTTTFDRLGGLARPMPLTTAAALLCGMSLAALPPLAGFMGEWLVLESLMQAFRTGNIECEVVFALAGATIGVAAGVAVVTFTKVIGIGMLGAARSSSATRAFERVRSPWRGIALVIGCLAILGVGIFAATLLRAAAPSIDELAGTRAAEAMIGTFPLVTPTFGGFSSVSPGGLAIMLTGFTLLFWIVSRLFARPPGRSAMVWTSGETYRAWTQYSGTGYSNPTRVILDAGVRTVREIEADPRRYRSEIRPFFDLPFYRAVTAPFLRIADVVRATQSGVIAAYLFYILAFTIVMLILFPSVRHW
ncbi:MAG TPA: proton-conducting transporter membrane subunit [Candidatus Acidoferrales bacterium]|nr:proton-conducting transporter membrane subunit [Candidatus Acidoferrales bacterium]